MLADCNARVGLRDDGRMSAKQGLLERYADKIVGVIGCYDRVVVAGTLTGIAHPEAMARVLFQAGVRCFDLGQYVEPLREQIRQNAEKLAAEHGLQIQFLPNCNIRKEALIAQVLAERGRRPGLVHIFSAMETCTTYRPWHDKATGKTGLKFTPGKCLHYYFYLIDPQLGLVYVRVPTWAPYRLQVYFNGHHWLASRLGEAHVRHPRRYCPGRTERLVARASGQRRVFRRRTARETRGLRSAVLPAEHPL